MASIFLDAFLSNYLSECIRSFCFSRGFMASCAKLLLPIQNFLYSYNIHNDQLLERLGIFASNSLRCFSTCLSLYSILLYIHSVFPIFHFLQGNILHLFGISFLCIFLVIFQSCSQVFSILYPSLGFNSLELSCGSDSPYVVCSIYVQ